MEDLVQQFLLRYKYCPLPAVGTLQWNETPAEAKPGEHILHAPRPTIQFGTEEMNSAAFIAFIAQQKNSTSEQAFALLDGYCYRLKNMAVYQEMELEHTGKFFIDADGKLVFRQYAIPEEFIPSINIKRVIRPDAVHQVRVGDTETTNVAMAEYYSEEVPTVKSKWWVAAILFATIAIASFVMYANDANHTNTFGNRSEPNINTAAATYQLINF